MKAVVVYFSLEGNTKYAAEKIAAELGADILELIPEEAYPTGAVSKFFWGGKSAVMGDIPPLADYEFDADKYDTVIIGSPLWAGKFAPPLRTFLNENDVSDKNIALFISCGGGKPDKAFMALKKAVGCKRVFASMRLINPLDDPASADERIEKFCRKIKLERGE